MCGFYSYHSKDEINRINDVDTRCSLQKSIDNGRELIELFKDKWDEETLKKQLYLQELSEYNLSLWEDME